MAVISTVAPSTAERIRSACARASDSMLAIPGCDPVPTAVHHLRPCGDAIVAVHTDSVATALAWQSGNSGLPGVLELTDRTPLALREPVRSLVWLRGTVRPLAPHVERVMLTEVAEEHPHPALLDVGHTTSLLWLQLGSAVVADATGADSVDVEDLRGATPDPFWEMETEWLQHLDEDHGDVIDQLARRVPPSLRRGRIRPLALDRYGITLRVEGDHEDSDVRLPFNQPVDDVDALGKAVRILIGCPFMNGIRKRA
ncbi:DUF2470 domain-containing protein [Antrihabitans cavernicola]|uniref:DUF2470 domain-containing protein n=1 Tax=Antrihabitans cavernicola TaxID=2495913 RepID=A0A5A7SGK0_9NOCA|nr:DUF2470 domain-containing protein [Spelaeibacter cavernicola]KAA0024724.1 DUF2470 domain-containing protein [Spelaeibacter cavernicola]